MGTSAYTKTRRDPLNYITTGMYVFTALSFLGLLKSSSFGASVYEIDAVIYLITMSLVAVLLNWYNKGRYEDNVKRSKDYIWLLFLQFAICAIGVCQALLQMRGRQNHVGFLTITVFLLNVAVMYRFACFTGNYLRSSGQTKHFYLNCNRVAASASVAVLLLTPLLDRIARHTGISLQIVPGQPLLSPLLNVLWSLIIVFFVGKYVIGRAIRVSLISYLIAGLPGFMVYYVTWTSYEGIWIPSLLSFFRYLSLLAIFCNAYVERSRMILHQQNLLRERVAELIQNRLDNMLLQINPHFLYNTLGSIKSLCMIDPERAADLVQQFSEYLHSNYSDMAYQQTVPFRKELDYVRQYLQIEQVRFPNLKVEYDIGADDFMIPSLSVQPLAENAVRHGIGQKRHNAGTLKISSRETAEAYEVIIEDDGAGFDPGAKKADDGHKHIGIANVRSRLELICGGRLQIESEPGKGTRCTIYLYKNGNDKQTDAGPAVRA